MNSDVPQSSVVTLDNQQYIKISHTELMEPFLMCIVSASDLWMWLSSNGALTAGRVDADHALFPYLTEDRIHRSAQQVGPITVVTDTATGTTWHPFGFNVDPSCSRALYKHISGNSVIFEELNPNMHARFRYSWSPSANFGWVRSVELENRGREMLSLEVTDGLLDIMPSGIDSNTELYYSNLADAYKRAERYSDSSVVLYTLQSLITDRAEPAESLTATMVCSFSDSFSPPLLDERILHPYQTPMRLSTAVAVGKQCSYLLRGNVTIASGSSERWTIVADTNLDHARLEERIARILTNDIVDAIQNDIRRGTKKLSAYLKAADGVQSTANPIADAHHYSNVLFNSMRGGIFPYGYTISIPDFIRYLRVRNSEIYRQYDISISQLGEKCSLRALQQTVNATGDVSLSRLTAEYLPLSFSRRHGDPSRPWNRFSIHTTDYQGNELLAYEGNWRDIFQNWEALLISYPLYIPNVVAKFLNVSTIEGYNPYRINQDGIEWEILDPDDPWSNIGYWGDHQIVYLLRLLELWHNYDTTSLQGTLHKQMFSFADVPYELVPHYKMVANPRATIVYNSQRAHRAQERTDSIGTDGKLAVDTEGKIVHVTMIEKLLIPALAKVSALVPFGGIWMNTQRPEWNDANNALAGYGLSMVTLYYLRRYIHFLAYSLLAKIEGRVVIRNTLQEWIASQQQVLGEYSARLLQLESDDELRGQFIARIAQSAEHYREQLYASIDTTASALSIKRLNEWCTLVLRYLDAIIAKAASQGGLCQSYNVIRFKDSRASVMRLYNMLEGQVAALSSGVLSGQESIALIDSLYQSELYQQQNHTFILYPGKLPPSFIECNSIPEQLLDRYPAVKAHLTTLKVLRKDVQGYYHFAPHLKNSSLLKEELQDAQADQELLQQCLELYEEVFRHSLFTGRSGSMFGYEGLGSIYWHMIGKLLLAVQECYFRAIDNNESSSIIAEIAARYLKIREGFGFRKSPLAFGAVPTDCYSHTPSHSGAQQPGMTGQVKEEIICRYGELGIRVKRGTLNFMPNILPNEECFINNAGTRQYSFSLCGISITVKKGNSRAVTVSMRDGSRQEITGDSLPPDIASRVFARDPNVAAIVVTTNSTSKST